MNISKIDRYIRQREGISDISRQGIEALQLQKLNALLQKEQERGGFYRNLPTKLDSLQDLQQLPFTTDEQLASQGGRMLLVSQGDIQRVLSDATSGTTGHSKRVFYTLGDCENTVELFMAGLCELIFPGSVTMICMPFSGPYGLGELIAEAVTRLGAKPLKIGVHASYGDLAAIVKQEQPDTFVGMPVQLLSLLRMCGRRSLRRALVSGDACPKTVLSECEKILGTKLFPHYGSREMGLGGAITCQCHSGMHLRENHVIAEIVDAEGNTLPDGEYGELVITTIGMEALPLIRYKTGDFTRILPGQCLCESEVRRLDEVRRLGEPGDIYELDNTLFTLPWLVDYRAKRTCGQLFIYALARGKITPEAAVSAITELTESKTEISVCAAADNHKSLYLGKRKIL